MLQVNTRQQAGGSISTTSCLLTIDSLCYRGLIQPPQIYIEHKSQEKCKIQSLRLE